MPSALDKIEYTTVFGTRDSPRLRLYSLSTCAFCQRAKTYLKDNGFSFEFVEMNFMDAEQW